MVTAKGNGKQNGTIRLKRKTIQKAKIIAARCSTSLSALLRHQIDLLVGEEEIYERAKRQALASLVLRLGQNGAVELWRVELPSAKRTLLHSIALPGVPAISNGFKVTVSRNGKSYAYQYRPINSTEYLVRGLG